MYSPRFDGDKDPVLFMNYTESSLRYSHDDYSGLIGKSTMIREHILKKMV